MTALVACVAQPAAADDAGVPPGMRSGFAQLDASTPVYAGMSAAKGGVPTLLPDERDEPLRLLALIGPVLAIGVLTILGFSISIRELRHDMRQRRIVYRQQCDPHVRQI